MPFVTMSLSAEEGLLPQVACVYARLHYMYGTRNPLHSIDSATYMKCTHGLYGAQAAVVVAHDRDLVTKDTFMMRSVIHRYV